MKKLLDNGNLLIVTQRSRSPSGHHDPFPLHANRYINTVIQRADSGAWFAFTTFWLKDGSLFLYTDGIARTAAQGDALLSAYRNFTVPPGIVGFFGEWYNFAWRPVTQTKLTDAQYDEWLATH